MSLQSMYNNAASGQWQHPVPSECGCNGRGWYVSDLDTIHQCQYHWDGQPSPECSDYYCCCGCCFLGGMYNLGAVIMEVAGAEMLAAEGMEQSPCPGCGQYPCDCHCMHGVSHDVECLSCEYWREEYMRMLNPEYVMFLGQPAVNWLWVNVRLEASGTWSSDNDLPF